ncbi:hypothetical protein DFH27DRAFT_341937 [Peziza echinospora]|nr:hypothetical protein DFH27DRAFT_341937 [Peziza echinospora]
MLILFKSALVAFQKKHIPSLAWRFLSFVLCVFRHICFYFCIYPALQLLAFRAVLLFFLCRAQPCNEYAVWANCSVSVICLCFSCSIPTMMMVHVSRISKLQVWYIMYLFSDFLFFFSLT